MINQYNAFISYKHEVLDSDIAATVQRQLEHFHIPKSIQKETGIKKIQRIFRDKEELPITSSLTETITNALEHSDYLIVICSTKTKESIWVDREIRTFLQNHDRSHVLTVLADGEPREVIPEILLSQEKIVADEEGNTTTITEPLEPLSGDYRLGKKIANKTEIPRLAAAIIGCSYDELINRSRQYAMRKMTAIMAAIVAISVGFGGYMFYSRYRVNEAYRESLRNQSRFLASESRSMFDDERRIIALQLALAALPNEDNPSMPVTAEATRALTDASLAYTSSDGFDYAPYYSFHMPNVVKEIAPASDGSYLVVRDAGNIVKCWNPYTYEELITVEGDGTEVMSINAIDNDKFVIVYINRIEAYSISQSKMIWSYDIDKVEIFDGNCLIVDENTAVFTSKVGFYVKLNLSDGTELDKNIFTGTDKNLMYYYGYDISPSKDKLVFAVFCQDYTYRIGIIDLNTREVSYSDPYTSLIKTFCWEAESRLYVAFSDGHYSDTSTSGTIGYNFNLFVPCSNEIACIDPTDMSKTWSYSFDSSGRIIGSEFMYFQEKDTLAYYIGNIGVHLEASSGKEIGKYDSNDTIISCICTDNSGEPMFITYSGYAVMPFTEGPPDTIITIKLASKDTVIASIVGGMFFVKDNDTDVICYNVHMHDKEYTVIEDNTKTASIASLYSKLDDDFLYLIHYDGSVTDGILIFDVNEKKFLGIAPFLEDYIITKKVQLLGSYDKKIYYTDIDKDKNLLLLCVDTQTLQTEKIILSPNYDLTDVPMCSLSNGKLTYVSFENGDINVHMDDFESGDKYSYVLENVGKSLSSPSYISEADLIFFGGSLDNLVDIKNGKENVIEYSEDWLSTTYIDYDPDSEILARTDGIRIEICNLKGEVLYRIDNNPSSILGLSIYKDFIIVACQNGSLYKYSVTSGKFLGKTDLTVKSDQVDMYEDENHPLYTLLKTDKTYAYDMIPDYENNLAYIQIAMTTNIIDMDSFYEIASIDKCFGYHKPTDTFLGYSINSNYTDLPVGYYKHYTLDELIENAKETLAGAELSPELKAKYGIK